MFILLESIGVMVTILEQGNICNSMTPAEFLKFDMNKKVMHNIVFPKLDSAEYIFKSYKVI